MRLVNDTNYDTKTLRSLVSAVHVWMSKDLKKGRKRIGRLPFWNLVEVRVTDVVGTATCSARVRTPDVHRQATVGKGGSVVENIFWVPVSKARTLEAALKHVQKGRGDLSSLLDTRSDATQVARGVWHNLLHLYGFGHKSFPQLPSHAFDWVEAQFGEKLPLKQPRKKVPKPKASIQQARYSGVLELEKKWLRKLKLAQTKLKKLRVKKRYYEREVQKNGNEARP